MNNSGSFFTSFVTALVVSVAVSAFFHYGLPKSGSEIAAELKPVAAELIEVPNLSGLDAAAARNRLEGLGLQVTIVEAASDSVSKGQVISTSPARFAKVAKGSTIEIQSSAGNPMVAIPNVKRMPPAKARRTLEEAGFDVEVKNIINEDFMFDRVLRQEPKADEKAKKGSTVRIIVNAGED